MSLASNLSRLRVFLGILFFLLGVALTTPTFASVILNVDPYTPNDPYGISPLLDWKIIETEHFLVTFHEPYTEVAQRAAHHLEEAHHNLSPLLRWESSYKIQVRILDNQDSANGLTTSAGRFGMILWVTPPDTWMNNYYYDDWLRLLIHHEYTHYLNMDTYHGIWVPARYLFGYTGLPNALWAPWMLEGLAVYMETRFTTAGRGRSPYYEMLLRSAIDHEVLDSRDFISFDKVNGSNPYYPAGDTRYQFGYQLMNEIARRTSPKLLGDISVESSYRIPYFINGILENTLGQDWITLWNSWIEITRTRIKQELKKIRSQPITPFRLMTESNIKISNEALGMAFSPDRKWMAYTLVSANRRQGLYLRDLKKYPDGITPYIQRPSDKLAGVGMRFTPDSQALIYSELNQQGQYLLHSDLKVYDLQKRKDYMLTRRLRARDPDVSPDGKWVAFTLTEVSTTGLARAPLIKNPDGYYELGPIEKLFMPPLFGHVANPHYSRDGTTLYLSYHPDKKHQADLLAVDLTTTPPTLHTVLSDGYYNLFPTTDSHNNLYYVSNKTGIQNIYRLKPRELDEKILSEGKVSKRKAPGWAFLAREGTPHFPDISKISHPALSNEGELITNFITGANLPVFVEEHLYASVFSYTGWDLAEIYPSKKPIDPKAVTISPPSAPSIDTASYPNPPPQPTTYSVQPYSSLPSLVPRAWLPLLATGPSGISLGAETLGFDTLNQHRYIAAAAYQTSLQIVDAYALYSNRTLGPDWTTYADLLTTQMISGNLPGEAQTVYRYSRRADFSTSISYPFLWTYSSFTPLFNFSLQKQMVYQFDPNLTQNQRTPIIETIVTPSTEVLFSFSNLETSRLAITSEAGRYSQFGARYYPVLGSNETAIKLYASDRENLRITPHTILVPQIQALWTSTVSPDNALGASTLQGRIGQNPLQSSTSSGLDQIAIRGYPGRIFYSQFAAVADLDLNYPLARVFGGLGTVPFFLQNLYGFVFAETSLLSGGLGTSGFQDPNLMNQLATSSTTLFLLPSVGTGIRLSTQAFYNLNLILSAELHQGLNRSIGGVTDLFVQVLLQGLQF